ncbi:hypothetical protein KTG15_06065 [Methanobacterium sp. YSL]|nr:hypothetical protein [Methanobacterium sp. YSL]
MKKRRTLELYFQTIESILKQGTSLLNPAQYLDFQTIESILKRADVIAHLEDASGFPDY